MTTCLKLSKIKFLMTYTVGCPTFWQLLRKNKLESNSDQIFVADFKNDVIFQLRHHLEVPPSGFYANFDLSRKRQELER